MDKHQHDLARSVAARDRGLARMRAAAISVTAASLVAAGAIAVALPNGASHHATAARSTQSSGVSGSSSGTSRSLSKPAATPTASSGTSQATSGGS